MLFHHTLQGYSPPVPVPEADDKDMLPLDEVDDHSSSPVSTQFVLDLKQLCLVCGGIRAERDDNCNEVKNLAKNFELVYR